MKSKPSGPKARALIERISGVPTWKASSARLAPASDIPATSSAAQSNAPGDDILMDFMVSPS
jgi:hypothetical protein